jgi:hypothetical protein
MPLLLAPALPLHTAGKYVAAAYIVFFALILIYVAIMTIRLNGVEREVAEMLERVADDDPLAAEQARLEHSIVLPEESAHVALPHGSSHVPLPEESARV